MSEIGADPLPLASAGVHILGYAAYIAFVRRGQIGANPLSWLMFAYGTALLTFLEYQSGASWKDLLLPAACSVSSIAVAALSVRTTKTQKLELPDMVAFGVDLLLTVAYVLIWFARNNGLSAAHTDGAVIGLLVCANATTISAFFPILRSTFFEPANERILPWGLWTAAYALLLIVTLQDATSIERAALLLYPALNMAFHLSIALLAMSRWWRPTTQEFLEVREAGNIGLGLFTTHAIRREARAFLLSGTLRRWRSRTTEDARRNENWFGIGKDLWVEPDAPYMFINHSCSPNLGIRGEREFIALRDIAAGEELTFDYSITEAEPLWRMDCICGARACRVQIGPIQTLPHNVFLGYLPYIGDHFRRVYLRAMQRSDFHQQRAPTFET